MMEIKGSFTDADIVILLQTISVVIFLCVACVIALALKLNSIHEKRMAAMYESLLKMKDTNMDIIKDFQSFIHTVEGLSGDCFNTLIAIAKIVDEHDKYSDNKIFVDSVIKEMNICKDTLESKMQQ